jgi:hypothetical protein
MRKSLFPLSDREKKLLVIAQKYAHPYFHPRTDAENRECAEVQAIYRAHNFFGLLRPGACNLSDDEFIASFLAGWKWK